MKEKTIQTVTAFGLTLAVLILSVCFLALPKTGFSENENRYLEEFPRLRWEQVKSGEYMSNLSTYLSDHFPFRDFFMGFKTQTETALGKREINQVFMAEDSYLIENYKKPASTERIGQTFYKFGKSIEDMDVDTKLMLVPTAITVYGDKLPKYAKTLSQLETAAAIYEAAGLAKVDCTEALLAHKNDGQLYYRTDHHWTTYGAYIGYKEYCQAAGLDPVALEDMEAQTVTEDFKGTIYSKFNDYSRKGDSITIYTNPSDKLTVNYVDTENVTDTLYNLDYVNKKDKYSLFLDNLHSLVEITNENAVTDRSLVLIKDSYANSMIPFLAHNYKKIYVFDTRSYKMGPKSFIQEHADVTDVLILYNMNTIDTDLGIRGIY